MTDLARKIEVNRGPRADIQRELKPNGFGASRFLSAASSLLGRGKAAETLSLQSKLQEAFTEPANRGVLDAALSVERIQKLLGK